MFNHCGGLSVSGVGVEDVEVLVALGLTGRQTRVYLALLKTGVATAKVAAKISQVNRQDIHRVINSLQETGLIQRKITNPTTFKATPIKETITALLQQKTNQIAALQLKTTLLTEKYNQTQTTSVPEKPCLGLLSENDHGKKHRQAIESIQHSIQLISTWKQFRQVTTLYENQLQNALKKQVTIKAITQKPQNHAFPNWISTAITKNHAFKLKTLTNPPTATLTVFDDSQAAIALSNTASFTRGPHLWTTNSTLITIAQAYFKTNWTQTKKLT
ncbi:MAG: hypothetical protein NWF00_10725 [Candidatus Bathyarchaeota archaeon]|nr:hypothetical protein [Candidatus Bathyarchaeota archaeon]